MSRSTTQLIVLADPAASVPPTRWLVWAARAGGAPPTSVATNVHVEGHPRAASTITGTVVTRSNSMMRGLVSATYARSTSTPDRGAATAAAEAVVTGRV